jgi:hypothetical protein
MYLALVCDDEYVWGLLDRRHNQDMFLSRVWISLESAVSFANFSLVQPKSNVFRPIASFQLCGNSIQHYSASSALFHMCDIFTIQTNVITKVG